METSVPATPAPVSTTTQPGTGERAVLAREPVRQGAFLLPLGGRLVDAPSKYTLQVGATEHLLPWTLDPDDPQSTWCFVNHACEANAVIDLQKMALVAGRDIAPGEEITFDYCSTEDVMAAPFSCLCGASTCYGLVRGYRHLTAAQRTRLESSRAPHLAGEGELSGRTESPRPR